jgi:hypothetical protein
MVTVINQSLVAKAGKGLWNEGLLITLQSMSTVLYQSSEKIWTNEIGFGDST